MGSAADGIVKLRQNRAFEGKDRVGVIGREAGFCGPKMTLDYQPPSTDGRISAQLDNALLTLPTTEMLTRSSSQLIYKDGRTMSLVSGNSLNDRLS
jgi:hypothetical protein